jgi:SAM-dependent methyltransferase
MSQAGNRPGPNRPECSSPEAVFTHVFHTNFWGSRETASGPGSEVHQTMEVRDAVRRVLENYKVESVIDAGCGDFNWQRHVPGLGGHIHYLGIDVVPDLIVLNRRRHANACTQFACLDITCSPLPQADLVICRDCLVHLGTAHVEACLKSIAASGSKYLLATTYPGVESNSDIDDGAWRAINLSAPPFCLPESIDFFDTNYGDNGDPPGNGLGLWSVASVVVDSESS